jgi:uncharacterized membrane protein
MDSSVATGINDSGTVVGVSFQLQNSANQQGFTWTSSAGMQPIPGAITALAINKGQVAGADTGNHAAIFSNGQTDDLGTIGGSSVSTSVNSSGKAVGFSETHAFFFDGAMRDLGLRDNWTSASATGINDAAIVVGNGLSGATSHPLHVEQYLWAERCEHSNPSKLRMDNCRRVGRQCARPDLRAGADDGWNVAHCAAESELALAIPYVNRPAP